VFWAVGEVLEGEAERAVIAGGERTSRRTLRGVALDHGVKPRGELHVAFEA
jgi:hypothetical protein